MASSSKIDLEQPHGQSPLTSIRQKLLRQCIIAHPEHMTQSPESIVLQLRFHIKDAAPVWYPEFGSQLCKDLPQMSCKQCITMKQLRANVSFQPLCLQDLREVSSQCTKNLHFDRQGLSCRGRDAGLSELLEGT